MYHLNIFTIGKVREKWLQLAIDEYLKRLEPSLKISFKLYKNTKQLIEALETLPKYTCLDPAGKERNSLDFSSYVIKSFEKGGARWNLVIGGDEGLPERVKNKHDTMSLSKMTLTHQMTRLILLEQIYRAFEIEKGSRYHK